MENLLATLVSFQTLLLCMGCYLVTYMIRTVAETVWVKLVDNRYWRDVFLPLGPIGTGMAILGLAHMFPTPDLVGVSLAAKLIYGGVAGLVSGTVYSRVKAFIAGAETNPS